MTRNTHSLLRDSIQPQLQLQLQPQHEPDWYVLSLFFIVGMLPWLLTNGVFSELPVLVHVSSRGYALATDMMVAVQIANILPFGLIIYMIVSTYRQKSRIDHIIGDHAIQYQQPLLQSPPHPGPYHDDADDDDDDDDNGGDDDDQGVVEAVVCDSLSAQCHDDEDHNDDDDHDDDHDAKFVTLHHSTQYAHNTVEIDDGLISDTQLYGSVDSTQYYFSHPHDNDMTSTVTATVTATDTDTMPSSKLLQRDSASDNSNNMITIMTSLPPPPHRTLIAVTLGCATMTAVLLSSLSMYTDFDHFSTLFVVLCGIAGGIGCISTITCWTFVSIYDTSLIVALSSGMGFASLIPSMLAIGQNAGEYPRFSMTIYFAIHAGILLFGVLCFMYIGYTDAFIQYRRDFIGYKQHQHQHHPTNKRKLPIPMKHPSSSSPSPSPSPLSPNTMYDDEDETLHICDNTRVSSDSDHSASDEVEVIDLTHTTTNNNSTSVSDNPLFDKSAQSNTLLLLLSLIWSYRPSTEMMLLMWISFVNFFVPGFSAYYVSGFSSHQRDAVLLWFNVLHTFSETIGRMITYFTHPIDFTHTYAILLASIQTICFVLLFLFGYPLSYSPAILIISYSVLSFLYGYTNTRLYALVSAQQQTNNEWCTRWLAFSEQLGSLIGAMTTLFVVQVVVQ
jgi:Solute carrier family 52, riboflavin transporter